MEFTDVKPALCRKKIYDSSATVDIYDKIHGIMSLSILSTRVFSHKIFQRLHNIKQLGSLIFKFNYAVGNRYEHSLGTAWLARVAARALGLPPKECIYVELAGLLHDVGHGPFSHSFDDLLHDMEYKSPLTAHEERSKVLAKIILTDKLSGNLSADEIDFICWLIDPITVNGKPVYHGPIQFTPGIEQIISNKISKFDVDKIDYILRDSMYLRYEKLLNQELNITGLLKKSRIVNGIWVFDVVNLIEIYELVCRRFIFYSNNYLEPDVQAIACMVTDALKILAKENPGHFDCAMLGSKQDVSKFIKLTDEALITKILNSSDDRMAAAKNLINRIVDGNLYKYIADVKHNSVLHDRYILTTTHRIYNQDKSAPHILLEKIGYHDNGTMVDHSSIRLERIFDKR